MQDNFFIRLNHILFLQTFVARSAELSAQLPGGTNNRCVNYIEQLGLTASGAFETAYRQNSGNHGSLDHTAYSEMIVAIKNKIGGNFSRASSEPGIVRVVNTRCPFGDAVRQAPGLCKMTSSVFGGIAARNFGYAKVILDKRIAIGNDTCEVRIYTDPKAAASLKGDEYHRRRGAIRGRSATVKVDIDGDNCAGKPWHGIRSTQNQNAEKTFIVARSPALSKALEVVSVVAPTTATVLIVGETGVGKEVFAKRIHELSERWNRNFVPVNCGAIPEQLIETILFGHERGAFTGAYEVHHGLFEQADGGTLFLDEIDSLPLAAQARLLRVLQGGEFERVGGRQRLSTDVRVIAAASRGLDKLAAEGAFRIDLYYRINVVPIHLPPLRERREDIVPLVEHILARLSMKYKKVIQSISDDVTERVLLHEWPGNVRELENVLERSFLFASGPVMSSLLLAQDSSSIAASFAQHGGVSLKNAKQRAAEQVETQILLETLTRFGGNIRETAKSLGVTPRAIHQRLNLRSIDPSKIRAQARLKGN